MSGPRAIKVKKGRIECEIEKLRSEANWIRAVEILTPHKQDPVLSYLFSLVMCESKLDSYESDTLQDEDMRVAEIFLNEALKTPDDQYKLEASVLNGKLLYLRRGYPESVQRLRKLSLTSVKLENYSMRSVRLISEGLAIQGLALEEMAQSTRRALSDGEKQEALVLYDLAVDLCIRHFQDIYKGNLDIKYVISFPKVVLNAVKRCLFLVYQSGNMSELVARFRYLIRFVETPSTRKLRQLLTSYYGELLLRAMCNKTYQVYSLDEEKQNMKEVLPYRYPSNRLVPDSLHKEAVLMLLISEHIANQEAFLNRPFEMSNARIEESFRSTSAVYDLLVIALSRSRNFAFLSQLLEKSLKFSYREFHIWYQFALALISARKFYRAYLVLRECLRLDSSQLALFFLTISLCFGKLNLIEDGLELALQAVETTASTDDPMMCARAHLFLGWGYSLLGRRCCVADQKRDLQAKAIKEYKLATQLDPDDYLAWYHLGVEAATQRHVNDALFACQHSVRLMSAYSPSLCLLALLHTMGMKRLDQAAKVLHVGLEDKPDDFSLLFLLAKVEAARQNPDAGFAIYRRLLELWKENFSNPDDSQTDRSINIFTLSSDESHDAPKKLLSVAPIDDMENEIVLSLPQVEPNLLASSLACIANGSIGHTGSSIAPTRMMVDNNYNAAQPTMRIQAEIYIGLAKLYLECERGVDAQDALDEALKITGLNSETLYLRGSISENKGQLNKARSIYESVIAIQSSHLEAHISLADLLRRTNQGTMAERVIRDAIDIDPTNFRVWQLLAQILSLRSTVEPASDTTVTRALMTAIDLEKTEPLEPFYRLPIGVHCH